MRVSMTMLVVAALTISTTLPAMAGLDPVTEREALAADLYPSVGAGTNFLNHAELLGNVPEPAWYEANVPFVDLPDREIRDTYYYRWRTYREALKYTGPKDGWIVSEFLGPVGYSAPNGGIVAAAGHHVYEGRWLRDHRYLDDYVDYWLRGSGAGPKPATDFLNENTTDWAHQYSFWAADAVAARAAVDGRQGFATDRLPELVRQWQRWSPQFDQDLGLYWQTPVWDAMEYTASSYQSPDPYHGGDGFRPTLNAYQYGDARAIAELYRARGDATTARQYDQAADALKANQEKWLWDDAGKFYKHVMRDDNPNRAKLADRESIGFVPWYFHMPPAANSAAWAQLTDPQGFAAAYGPTTAERRSPWFMKDALNGCCRWNGPSWPYATSQTLTALANLLIDYPAQPYVDRDDYLSVLRGYALTQRKNGQPYVAEAHHPDENRWIYDGKGHSEDYNHSTFNDNVLSGLLGIRPQLGDTVRIAPLAPSSWSHFAAENVPYHGHNLTVLWDRDGSKYGKGAGLRVWVDGTLKHTQTGLTAVNLAIPARTGADLQEQVDDFANVSRAGFPTARASYSYSADPPTKAIDGQDFHLDVPGTRWTSYGSPNAADWLEVDLGAPTTISDLRVAFYDDGGGVRVPTAFDLQYWDGQWRDMPGQQRSPAQPVARQVNRVLVQPALTTSRVRILPRRADGGAVGITAISSWRSPVAGLTAVVPDDLAIRGGAVETTTTLTAQRLLRGVQAALAVPPGWTATPLTPAYTAQLASGQSLVTRWRVTAPGLRLGERAPIRVLATASGESGTSSAVGSAQTVFDPADYGRVLWDDTFDTDRGYRVDGPFGEPAPALRVANGVLTASAGSRAGAVLAAPVAGDARGTAVVVEPRSFAGSAPEDSLFLGQTAGNRDFALAWFNNAGKASGVDVTVGGVRRGDEATGGCCATLNWAAGDRLAVVLEGGQLTSWQQHGTRWTLLRSAPIGAVVDPAVVAGWEPGLGLRLDAGALTIDRFTVRARN
ncbi:discoidin domain-containing protein [Lentzea sp. HUAS12]|uniref:MGH1-like glycoside hydrolase domain-containing protein n=1 Tax=Lentzea sp. HUAS12 TaxID=2951806 RepID=UPI00209EEC64|nr:discoidin domain-containing protein [Lentzea sp. HUAS12]USX53413.1 discoidin domain-containing protein [Lentzea sp. HUAS12]